MGYDNHREALPVGRLQLWWVLLLMGRGEERKLSAKFATDPNQLLICFYCFLPIQIILKLISLVEWSIYYKQYKFNVKDSTGAVADAVFLDEIISFQ